MSELSIEYASALEREKETSERYEDLFHFLQSHVKDSQVCVCHFSWSIGCVCVCVGECVCVCVSVCVGLRQCVIAMVSVRSNMYVTILFFLQLL